MNLASFILGFVLGEVVGLVSTLIIVNKRKGNKA